ncbi:hypothetical protein KHA93_02670 [Bacillus sp. FJAT-49732]|uniref:Uncharacterized protein n=1 Tax=Lederbergia citrisecunda TaxID=2833583 RepID=A0A942TI73_9BACI|nr:hypothetical protein [Lederbergia citrisecunda]MBS4198551.1 hypothetical protein [Lederbergia citrisecunda]
MKARFTLVIILLLILSFIITPRSMASWAHSFVVWEGYAYVISDEIVEDIDKEIGHVTKYSDKEGSYWGNFSNTYQKGTKYFSIFGTSTDEAIAVQTPDGTYVKAIREGEYRSEWPLPGVIACIIVLLALILGIIIFRWRRGLNK